MSGQKEQQTQPVNDITHPAPRSSAAHNQFHCAQQTRCIIHSHRFLKTMPKPKESSHGSKKSGRRPRPHPRIIARQRARALMRETFLDNNLMDGASPGRSLLHFQRPHLRRCPYDLSSATFIGRVNSNHKHFRSTAELDGGLDGYNWKIRFGKGGPAFVLKLVRLLPTSCLFFLANNSPSPVLGCPSSQTSPLLRCSRRPSRWPGSNASLTNTLPTPLSSTSLSRRVRTTRTLRRRCWIFLWRVGFAHVPATKADNWEGGVLLDHSDIVYCNGHGWDTRLFGYRRVDQILR